MAVLVHFDSGHLSLVVRTDGLQPEYRGSNPDATGSFATFFQVKTAIFRFFCVFSKNFNF